MTQKRDRIVAWAIRKDVIAKVTARLKGEELRPQPARHNLRASARLAKYLGDQFDRSMFKALSAKPLAFNRIGLLDVVES